MKLGVVAALEREVRPALEALGAAPSPAGPFPSWSAGPFRFIVSGIGVARAERAALTVAEDVQGLLSVGFCGALDDTLAPGDLVLGGSQRFDPSPELLSLLQRTGPHRTGRIEMVERVVVRLEEKQSIARTTGAVAVDMESAAVGKVARGRGLPFLCIKAVLDTPSLPLASSYSGGGKVALEILRRPWILGRMIADGRRAKAAAEKLGGFFAAAAKEISPLAG